MTLAGALLTMVAAGGLAFPGLGLASLSDGDTGVTASDQQAAGDAPQPNESFTPAVQTGGNGESGDGEYEEYEENEYEDEEDEEYEEESMKKRGTRRKSTKKRSTRRKTRTRKGMSTNNNAKHTADALRSVGDSQSSLSSL
ncbi:hypothetical protein [Halonotius sp. GCM10025705]|uniref:hypothetical protein n=1 Tax=Halonotius sp. GCM10025705 TaxID=3252678 RepID=UPI003607FCF6